MAEQGSSQEKTEQPTPKRLRDARKKGQVFKSRDLETVVVMIAAFAALVFSRSYMVGELRRLMELIFKEVGHADFQMGLIYQLGYASLITLVKISVPFLTTVVVVAALVGFLQVGPVFSIEPLKPQTKRLNAIENLKNMLKPKILFELAKNVFKVVVVFLIAYLVVKGMLEPFLLSVTVPLDGSSKLGSIMLVRFLLRFFIFFMILAILDLMMQRREYIKNLKMTKEEVKREYKEDEGDPLIRSQRKQLHMEMAMGDVRQQVKNADVVITNPTHLAIALKYDKVEMIAPQIVAKGQRLFAEFIKQLAEEYEIPVVRNIPLAWSLIELDIGDEVPENLYLAVAEVLTFVYKLKQQKEE
ncbi:MAG: EscU/YscU/HrcU family type III secretion system export apparatus switch protein [Deltaproteobacteria bacterium]|nr:EscU/YscU/HrcU family type III secretion system export apparatus switch protein [Deltaproteobacteria bacterium]